jgi:antitoxin ParD1/3/4
MTVTLRPELEALLKRKVEEGRYASTEDVLEEALFLLEERDTLRDQKLQSLRQEIALGLNSLAEGSYPLDDQVVERVLARGRERVRLDQEPRTGG